MYRYSLDDFDVEKSRDRPMKKLITLLCLAMIAALPASAQNRSNAEYSCELDIHFEVPEFIEEGLVNGSMERVGGVIIDSDNQQTIAWLRQGGQIGQVAESSAGLLEHVTRLSGGANLALGRLLASVTPVLNISMAGFSLIEHIAGIRAHEAELERIYDRVSEEFQRDREVELEAALDYAENILLARSDAYKYQAVARATSELGVARKQLLRDLEELLQVEDFEKTVELAMSYQVLAMRVCVMSSRLHLEIGEDEIAKDELAQCVGEHENFTRLSVQQWLGDSPALYFHESVGDDFLGSYLEIERWLRGDRNVLWDIIHQYRHDFWDDEATEAIYSDAIVNKGLVEEPFYVDSLPNSEILIENYRRLEGLERELNSMCLPTFAEWEAYDGEDGISLSEHDDHVLLVNTAALKAATDNDA